MTFVFSNATLREVPLDHQSPRFHEDVRTRRTSALM